MKFAEVIGLSILGVFLFSILIIALVLKGDTKQEQQPKQEDYTYAVIYTPNSSDVYIEGNVEHYALLQSNIYELKIGGYTYYVSADNCIIQKGMEK